MTTLYDDLKRQLRKHRVDEPTLDFLLAKITPELARELLRNNENVRRIKNAAVTRYSADMLLDRWAVTGEALIIDREGKLRNGQHRLEACVRADRPFTTVVVMGVEAATELDMDTGAKRSLGDYLGKHGYADPKNLAATIRLAYMLVEEKRVHQDTGHYTNELLLRWFLGKHKGLVADLQRVRLWEKGWPKGFTRTYAASIRHAASYVPGMDMEEVDAFFSALAYAPETLQTRGPAFQLHQLFARVREKDRIQQPTRAAMTIRALNAYLAGEEVSAAALQWRQGGSRPDPFPLISIGAVAEAVHELDT